MYQACDKVHKEPHSVACILVNGGSLQSTFLSLYFEHKLGGNEICDTMFQESRGGYIECGY